MSLILEALNRSNQDRHVETGAGVPGLDTPAYVEPVDQGKTWTALVPWLALFAAIVIIGVLLADKFRAAPDTSAKISAPAHSETAAAITQFERQEPIAVRSAGEPQLQSRSLPEKTSAAVYQRESQFSREIESGALVGPAPDARVAALYGRQGAAGKAVERAPEQVLGQAQSSAEETPIDMAQLLARTEAGLKNSRLLEHPAPFIADLSQQKKDAIPSILYRHHDFSSNPTQSSVVLNGKRLKVGQQVANGIKLEEILPDSIVLNQRGEQFRLRALNSWVNL